MREIPTRDFETENLLIKRPTMDEQYTLWQILKDESVNRYYFPTPERIFKKNNLSKEKIEDLVLARNIFMEQLNDWERQKPFYERKIESITAEDNSQKFTWSIFTKEGVPIGQITVQPKDEYLLQPDIRDVGWFISPMYQGHGYATEAAEVVLDFMFNEVEIEKVITSAAIINPASWRLMEKLGFVRNGEKSSTYFDDDGNILKSYCYECDREKFNNRIINNPLIKKLQNH